MYHEDGNVDVELLADIGHIAKRLRSLETTWNIELKDLQRQSINGFGKPPVPSSVSLSQLNELVLINEQQPLELISQLKHLENTVIKVHVEQELHRKQKQYQRKCCMMNYAQQPDIDEAPPKLSELAALEHKLNKNDDEKDKENQSGKQHKISNEELKLLIKELKRKVDYTERMNWLCKYIQDFFVTIL